MHRRSSRSFLATSADRVVVSPPPEPLSASPSPSPREGGTRADGMPLSKDHFFNVRTPPGTSVDEVIDALEALIGTPEIYSVQHFGRLDFQVGVNSLPAVQVLLDCGGLRLGTHVSQLIPVARQVPSVPCLYLPSFVPHNEVADYRTGTRHIKMDMRSDNPLPNFARVSGHRATFEYTACGVLVHRTDTCTAACRRCGGAHASVDCTARKSYIMAAAMDVDEFPILGRTSATEQSRLTTLRRAKRRMPRDTVDEREAGGIQAKASAPTAASETQHAKGEASEINEEGAASMRSMDERSHPTQATHTQATAAAPVGSCSGADEHGLRRASASDGEGDDDAVSATSWAPVDDTTAEENRLERGRSDSTEVRSVAAEGPQCGKALSLEEKPTQEGGSEIPQSWWDKGGVEEMGGSRSWQPSRSDEPSGSAEPENTKTLGEQDALQSALSSHMLKAASQRGRASQQSGREEEPHGDRKGGSVRKPADTATLPGTRRNSGEEPAETSSFEEQQPGELVIDEHAPTPPGTPKRTTSTTPTQPRGTDTAPAETAPRCSGLQARALTDVPSAALRRRVEKLQRG
ncbi:hypothetical protein HPB50_004364 [Hyalomma asiaticum]|uniref:Uncharacterized protein n=1 Tax=Hyalomma asiaticum TaxID=266040 RepID=A0ACB7RGS3_HYAAI|nr:hypothetical protein HPB50_004364 [Hyalomma asiaticum]